MLEDKTQVKELRTKLTEAIALCDGLISGECTHDSRQEITTMGESNRTFVCFDCDEEWKEELVDEQEELL